MAEILKRPITANVKEVGQLEYSYVAGLDLKCYNHFENLQTELLSQMDPHSIGSGLWRLDTAFYCIACITQVILPDFHSAQGGPKQCKQNCGAIVYHCLLNTGTL